MSLRLDEAGEQDRRLIASLLDAYLAELSSHRVVPVGATDAASYPYLNAYWSEPGRHAFIMRDGDHVVGFALIREPVSTGSAAHELSEFYVKPESRRLRVGQQAIEAIWKRFPGDWELQVDARNSAAIRFWESCIATAASTPPQARDVRATDGGRVQFNFRVEARRPTSRCS